MLEDYLLVRLIVSRLELANTLRVLLDKRGKTEDNSSWIIGSLSLSIPLGRTFFHCVLLCAMFPIKQEKSIREAGFIVTPKL